MALIGNEEISLSFDRVWFSKRNQKKANGIDLLHTADGRMLLVSKTQNNKVISIELI